MEALQLVAFAKAYSGLTDEEFRQADAIIRTTTLEKFGPVRGVKPSLVFELGFEGINRSSRRKSGIAVRFPRMLRVRAVLPFHMLLKAGDSMNADRDVGTPVSVKIRERIVAARKRFHSNDNIAAFIEPGELEQLLEEVEAKMQGVLDSMVIDTTSDHNTNDTARRVARMYLNEVFKGRYVEQPRITEFPNVERLNELMIVGPITVRSACSHHFCPVMGQLGVGVMPNEPTNVIGLSKYARLAEWVMGRPQIQEEAVVQLADLIMEKTQPDGLAIVMEATHFCMAWRGVKDVDAKMINSVMRGAFLTNSALRREFLALIPGKN